MNIYNVILHGILGSEGPSDVLHVSPLFFTGDAPDVLQEAQS